MIVELVLLLGIYAFILMGVFFGPYGPMATFKNSGPRLGAQVERNITVGYGFEQPSSDGHAVDWVTPQPTNGGPP